MDKKAHYITPSMEPLVVRFEEGLLATSYKSESIQNAEVEDWGEL